MNKARMILTSWGTTALGIGLLTAVAFAAPQTLSEDVTTSVSPGVEAQLDLDETLDVTLHLQGTPDSDISVEVSVDNGSVDPTMGTLNLNPQGKAAFDVVYTPSAEGEDTLTFSSEDFEDVVVNITVNAAEEPEEEEEEEEAEENAEENAEANHGHCVAGWAQRAKAEGLKRQFFGQFVSTVADDSDAIADSKDDIINGDAPESCDFADLLTEKLAEMEEAGEPGAQGAEKANGNSANAPGRNR